MSMSLLNGMNKIYFIVLRSAQSAASFFQSRVPAFDKLPGIGFLPALI